MPDFMKCLEVSEKYFSIFPERMFVKCFMYLTGDRDELINSGVSRSKTVKRPCQDFNILCISDNKEEVLQA